MYEQESLARRFQLGYDLGHYEQGEKNHSRILFWFDESLDIICIIGTYVPPLQNLQLQLFKKFINLIGVMNLL